MIEVVVPGFVYYECLDPACTEWPRENPDVAKPTYRKRGYGGQFVYAVTEEQADLLFEHVRVFADAISFGVDDPSVGRRIGRWLDKVGR